MKPMSKAGQQAARMRLGGKPTVFASACGNQKVPSKNGLKGVQFIFGRYGDKRGTTKPE